MGNLLDQLALLSGRRKSDVLSDLVYIGGMLVSSGLDAIHLFDAVSKARKAGTEDLRRVGR